MNFTYILVTAIVLSNITSCGLQSPSSEIQATEDGTTGDAALPEGLRPPPPPPELPDHILIANILLSPGVADCVDKIYQAGPGSFFSEIRIEKISDRTTKYWIVGSRMIEGDLFDGYLSLIIEYTTVLFDDPEVSCEISRKNLFTPFDPENPPPPLN